MATRLPATALHPITQTDLRACLIPADVFALFRKLGYPIVEPPVALALDDDTLPGALRDGVAARYQLATVGGARPGDPRLDVTLFVLRPTEKAGPMVLARGIAQVWTRRIPGNHLLVFAVPGGPSTDFQRLIIVNPRRLGEGAVVRFKLHKLIVERDHPTRHDAETLNNIAMSHGMDADALYQRQCDAFNVERLTDEFYKEYRRRFDDAMARIKEGNPHNALFEDRGRLHTFTQRLFGRVMFLYFLQKKRALNDEQDFITRRYTDAIQAGESFYHDVLRPLFFEILNRQRPDNASPFGKIPYLNGGLFAEEEEDKANLNIADDLFDPKSDTGLLNFLDRYNFTIEEDTPLETQVALDPEMLGKVFENLLEAEERGKSGTFYTPRPVVAFMCREALAAYLSRAVADLAPDRLGWLLDEAETGEPARDESGQERLTYRDISYDLHQRIERALQSVRVLDPAVGSGAFPLGMLALLIGVRRALHRIRQNVIDPHARLLEDWKRQYIRDCLYGVDIRREAIEIARLRLWLSLVVDADPFTMEPLPNLDYKLMDGDSLIETLDGVPIYPTRPADGPTQSTWDDMERRTLIERLEALQRRYFQPESGDDRATLKRDIHVTERALLDVTLSRREEDERNRLENNLRKQANLRGAPVPRDLKAEEQALTRSINATVAAREAFQKSGASLPFFLYRLHFASVFEERGGFDIVIANPPYVSILNMEPNYKEALKQAYPGVAAGRADLYVYFYARALELLRDEGMLAFISSNKFLRVKYGKGLTDLLVKKTRLRFIIDFSGARIFDATLDPCLVMTERAQPMASDSYTELILGKSADPEKLPELISTSGNVVLQAQGTRPSTPIAAKLELAGVRLWDYLGHDLYRGIVTGLNKAFVVDTPTRDSFVASDPDSSELLRQYLRGRDVQQYCVDWSGLWIIYTHHGIDIERYPAIKAYLELFREKLEARATRQAWYELQQPQFAYKPLMEGPKIVYPEMTMTSRFAFDNSGHFLNNKAFFIPSQDYFLLGILNSRCAWYWIQERCSSQGNPLERGRLELRETSLRKLPVPVPSVDIKKRLESLVLELLQAEETDERAALQAQVDKIVYALFGLTPSEITEVERRTRNDELKTSVHASDEEREYQTGDDDGAEEQEAGQ